jgi:aldehyde dehydrogenase (NAD+)
MNDANTLPKYPHLINGNIVEPSSGRYIDVYSPATGNLIAKTADGNAADVDLAVNAASSAFKSNDWKGISVLARSKILYQIGNTVLANAQELAILEVQASGGTIKRVMGLDILAIADLFFTLAETIKTYPFIENLPPKILPEQVHTMVVKEPVGVCGIITAWNFPLLLLAWKIAPALAAGNTVVVKASELTPTSTFRLIELINTFIPPGVLNVVSGSGQDVGDALVKHPKVNKISFTGSTQTGRNIQIAAAATLKRVTLELGGKGAAIVMPDANIDLVAHGALFGIMMNSGQACEASSRLIVHVDIHDALVAKMKVLAEKIVVGNPLDPATGMGPIISKQQFNRIEAYLNSAKEQGAHIVTGGDRKIVDGFENGYFLEPTIISNCQNDMKHSCEEIFGPVVSIIKFTELDEAITIANDSIYGLSAGIWTEDVIAAQAVARQLEAGSVWINDWHMMRTDAPFGGMKQSGYGREMSHNSLNSYTELKSISTAFERDPRKKSTYHLVHTF